MGTNVYAIRKKWQYSDFEDKISELCKNHDLDGLISYTDKIKQKMEYEEVHIGKRSCGWKFIFNHNNWKYYGADKDSIMEFLKSCDSLENEYGDELTPEQFWREYVEDFKDGFGGKEYAQDQIDKAIAKERGEIEDKFGFIPTVSQARNEYNVAECRNFYEEKYDKEGNLLDYSKMDYRFSDSTEFC
jgi:hypothetical protein